MIFYKSVHRSSYLSYPELWEPDECVFFSNYSNSIVVMKKKNVDKFIKLSNQNYSKTSKKEFEKAYEELLKKINKKFH
jgi:glutathionyl-hydroquinone reductase